MPLGSCLSLSSLKGMIVSIQFIIFRMTSLHIENIKEFLSSPPVLNSPYFKNKVFKFWLLGKKHPNCLGSKMSSAR